MRTPLPFERDAMLARLSSGETFDLVVIGAGASGCGIAVDAAARGLRVALIDKQDFGEGTSCRSTKLVHGGVRYLEQAITRMDRAHFQLVRDGLRERFLLLANAPHLARPLALVTPLYSWRELPYVAAGLKLYDLLAGRRGIGPSQLLGRKEALRRFPWLRSEGLKAGVLYHDGQFHDARMILALALTAAAQGAVVVNHVEAIGFVKHQGKIVAVNARDTLGGKDLEIRARGVINAAGPFVDRLRQLDEPHAEPLLRVSSGIHLVLDGRFAPPPAGLLIPRTDDGRVLFVLPWEGRTLVGTTDEAAELSEHPRPGEQEIAYLLDHLRRYFAMDVRHDDIRAAWSGLRPLVAKGAQIRTARLSRDHQLFESAGGLLSITGGKWTTYRQMAEDSLDRAIELFQLKPQSGCATAALKLIGARHWRVEGAAQLARRYPLDKDMASHLHRHYGDQAAEVAQIIQAHGHQRLHPEFPYLEAEVIHAARAEMAPRAIDVLARRLSLALLDTRAAQSALPRVLELLAVELGWSVEERAAQQRLALQRLTEGL